MKKSIITLSVLGALSLGLPAAMADTTAMPAAPAKPASKPMMAPAHKKPMMKHVMHASMMVKKAQEALNKHGAMLKVDGMMGPKTRAAIMSFQKANGLKPTGHLTKMTLGKLEAK
ncbi:hypothetical protein BJI67_13130 [Acidihalobacter aeolianus]|uniref:Peptidoglycan binding-like domain-containing protein n=1 Tax=Acidihalobacter aeolianus TaxID=2792603 RepID=A0A1D8KA73_9GAMM|nr:peptidoglycan-binding domain-containing protein [Acidihalobacter aeolianus]AOV17873.1 hypothetical protein BJI67_13130 [Acidihalobacter aeolianus]